MSLIIVFACGHLRGHTGRLRVERAIDATTFQHDEKELPVPFPEVLVRQSINYAVDTAVEMREERHRHVHAIRNLVGLVNQRQQRFGKPEDGIREDQNEYRPEKFGIGLSQLLLDLRFAARRSRELFELVTGRMRVDVYPDVAERYHHERYPDRRDLQEKNVA